MNFIFITRRPTPPLFLGGAEITHNYLARKLVESGANVFFIGSLVDPNFPTTKRYKYYWNKLLKNKSVRFISHSTEEVIYEYQGIKCYLYSQNTITFHFCKLLDTIPYISAVITSMEHSSDFIKIAKERKLYTIGWLHSCNREGMDALKGQPNLLLSTSLFIQQQAKKYSNDLNYVFYPAFDSVFNNYTKGTALTFINPVKEKGANFILNLAALLPQEHFLCVEGWYKDENFYSQLLPNMTYLPPQQNMEKVWKKTRILLVPSVAKEAFGRVIVEAHIRGIPVVAHNIGGISEAMNGAGILLNNLVVGDWMQAINDIDEDMDLYKTKAIASAKKFVRDVVKDFLSICKNF